MVDAQMRKRIEEADERAEDFVRGPMPEARFDLEDVVRLMVWGHLRKFGWEGTRLMKVFRKPYIVPFQTQSDGHTAKDQRVMPKFMAVYYEREKDRLNREIFDTFGQVGKFLAQLLHLDGMLSAHVIDLKFFREVAIQQLAQVELERERRAERLAAEKVARDTSRKKELV
jgi:hypothetical protein